MIFSLLASNSLFEGQGDRSKTFFDFQKAHRWINDTAQAAPSWRTSTLVFEPNQAGEASCSTSELQQDSMEQVWAFGTMPTTLITFKNMVQIKPDCYVLPWSNTCLQLFFDVGISCKLWNQVGTGSTSAEFCCIGCGHRRAVGQLRTAWQFSIECNLPLRGPSKLVAMVLSLKCCVNCTLVRLPIPSKKSLQPPQGAKVTDY